LPIPEFQFEDEARGLPQQKVPLRFAVLVSGLTVNQLVEMTTNTFQLANNVIISLLNCYEYSGRKIRKCSPATTLALLDTVKKLDSEKERFKKLPSGWFVYSDELASAYSNWIDLTVSREYAVTQDMGLNWNPALYPFEKEIQACSLLPVAKSELSPREKSKQATVRQHKTWHMEYVEAKKKNPALTDTHIATTIAKNLSVAPGTVRRVISTLKKNS
jgi:hypothetical protein